MRLLRFIREQESVMASLNDPSDTHGRLIAASKVNGTNVYNRAGEKLGSIYDVILAKDSGKAKYAIMSFGGFLGIGENYHPLPWDVLSYSPEHDGYVVDLDRDRLEGAPSCAAGEMGQWDDPAYGRRAVQRSQLSFHLRSALAPARAAAYRS
jgi:sporulation protein YlmC with PRC-barrel domain